MSKSTSKIEIYSLTDFKKASRLDRIRMYMIEPEKFDLNNEDFEYYQKLHQAYHLVFDELRQSVAIKAIQTGVQGAESWYMANRLFNDVCEVFTPFIKKNKELKRMMVLEKLYGMAKVAEGNAVFTYTDPDTGTEHQGADKEWMELAAKLLVEAAKIEGLDKQDVELIDPDEIQIPLIEITSDPAAFLEEQGQNTDEDEYEDED